MSCRFCSLLLLLLGLWLPAQGRHLTGRVVDDRSGEELPGVTVELLRLADSTLVRSAVTSERTVFGWKTVGYDIDVDNNTAYLLRFSMVGYRTLYRRVDVKMAERVNEQYVDEVRLVEDVRLLDEVVVKATKIKMVMRGDTVVYDVSAFSLSEGSMLDALIRQLPGTTLENGVIKVNGRTVSALLVDGRDFFKGDAKKALENLPAYTVDKVKAYDKRGRESRMMGRDMGDKELVLDVGLKKQYQRGLLANADMAGGTNHRYSGQLFAMHYSKHARLTLLGSMNNLNSQSMSGDYDMSPQPDTGGGLSARKTAGLNYRWEGKTEDTYVESENGFAHTDNETLTQTTSQTFLTGGDYYGLSRDASRAKTAAWTTNNSFGLTPGRHFISGSFGLTYARNEGWGSNLSGRFSERPASSALLDSLFRPGAGRRLLAMTVNRVRNDNQNHGQSLGSVVSLRDNYRLGKTGDFDNMLSVAGDLRYNHGKNYRHALNRVDYPAGAGTQDLRHQYSTTPTEDYALSVNVDYSRFFNRDSDKLNTMFVRPFYRFNQSYQASDYSLYRLDRLADYVDETYALGMLPSTQEALLSVRDAGNSYSSREHTRSHTGGLQATYIHGDGVQMPRWSVYLSLPVEFRHERIGYVRAKSYARDRNATFFSPSVRADYLFNDSTGMRNVSFSYNSSQTQPSLVSLLDVRDDADPLVVRLGNPGLHKARTHSVGLSASLFRMRSQEYGNVGVNYSVVQHAVATSMLYNKETGVTTTQQVNVDGNWSLSGNVGFGLPVDRRKRLSLHGNLSANYNNSVDLTTVEGTQPSRSEVHNWVFSEQLTLEYQLGSRLQLRLSANADHQRATSDRSDFQRVSSWNVRVGLGGTCELPWGLQLSTDLTDYRRQGYNDARMNTGETVWNARLTKRLLKDRLTLSVDGFDILGQLSNTSFTLDSQGRAEVWTNTLTRYVMAHVAYKFTLGAKAPRY